MVATSPNPVTAMMTFAGIMNGSLVTSDDFVRTAALLAGKGVHLIKKCV